MPSLQNMNLTKDGLYLLLHPFRVTMSGKIKFVKLRNGD